MNTVKVIKDPRESYFKKITLFEFEIGGEYVNISYVEDSNKAYMLYWDFDYNQWVSQVPKVISDLGRDEEGCPLFRYWLHAQRFRTDIKEGAYNFDEWKKEYLEDMGIYN
jgi:hypothetical protein